MRKGEESCGDDLQYDGSYLSHIAVRNLKDGEDNNDTNAKTALVVTSCRRHENYYCCLRYLKVLYP